MCRVPACARSQGGLKPGMIVELGNGSMAMVMDTADEAVRLDANSMFAGGRWGGGSVGGPGLLCV